jgi:hypothetical protein
MSITDARDVQSFDHMDTRNISTPFTVNVACREIFLDISTPLFLYRVFMMSKILDNNRANLHLLSFQINLISDFRVPASLFRVGET